MRIGLDDDNDSINDASKSDQLADLIKESSDEKKTKFSDLSGKKKAEYIWDYYKWWIICGIAAIIGLTVFIRDWRENAKPTYLHVEMLNTYFGADPTNTVYDDFAAASGVDLTKEHLFIGTDTMLSTESFDTTMMAYQQRLIASYAAAEIDVVTGPKKIIEGPANCDYYADFEKTIPKDLLDEIKDRDYELYYYYPSVRDTQEPDDTDDQEDTEDAGNPYCAGIYLDNCSYLNNMGESGAYPVAETEEDRPVLVIVGNSQRTDQAVDFVRFLVENR